MSNAVNRRNPTILEPLSSDRMDDYTIFTLIRFVYSIIGESFWNCNEENILVSPFQRTSQWCTHFCYQPAINLSNNHQSLCTFQHTYLIQRPIMNNVIWLWWGLQNIMCNGNAHCPQSLLNHTHTHTQIYVGSENHSYQQTCFQAFCILYIIRT